MSMSGHKVYTCLWFERGGAAAAEFYVSLLPDSHIVSWSQTNADGEPLVAELVLAGTPIMILNGGPAFKPNPFASICVRTKDQAETDHLWNALTANGGAESRCGWLTDKFGVSWQIVPVRLLECMTSPDAAAAARARDAMLTMNKINIAAIEAAFAGA